MNLTITSVGLTIDPLAGAGRALRLALGHAEKIFQSGCFDHHLTGQSCFYRSCRLTGATKNGGGLSWECNPDIGVANLALSLTKLFSFTSWTTNHPREPIPGDRLDAELDEIRKAVETLSRQIDDVRRPDGKLRNDLITNSTLDPRLVNTLTEQLRARIKQDLTTLSGAASTATRAAEEVKAYGIEAKSAATVAREAAAVLRQRQTNTIKELQAIRADAQAAASAAAEERRAIDLKLQGSRASGGPGDGGAAEAWADCSRAWAEFMDGNNVIPQDLIEQENVNGDHWSARWWAHRAGELGNEAVEGIFKYYIGAFQFPPTECPNGDALTPGVLDYDTTEQLMYVWDGDSWNPLVATIPTPADLTEFHYTATAGQAVFGGVDIFGNTPDHLLSGNANVFVNGVRLTERLNWVVVDDATVKLSRGVTAGSIVTVEWFGAPDANVIASKIDTNIWLFDGSKTTFPIYVGNVLYEPASAANVLVSIDGVMLDPGVDFTISGSDITFCEAPLADARKWGIAGLPLGSGGGTNVPVGFSSLLRCIYAATTTSQTVFGGMDKYGAELSGCSDTANIVSVHVNGVLIEPSGFTVLSDNQIQLTRGVALGSSVTVDVISVGDGGGTAPVDHSHDCGVFG